MPIVIVYRSFLAVFCSTWIVYSAATSPITAKTFFYLTKWTYACITAYFILSTILTILHYTRRTKKQQHRRLINQPEFYDDESRDNIDDGGRDAEDDMKWYHRLVWILLNISSNMSLCVTISFWALVYDGKTVRISDIFVHILNSVFMVLEVVLSSVPLRILHLIYPLFYGLFYTFMTVLFWLLIDKTPVYIVLDYTHKPGLAAGVLVGSHFILLPLVQIFLYLLHRLRNCLSAKYSERSD